MFDYRSLEVWHKARALVHDVYLLTESFPSSERFGLVSQSRRASVSVAANLAEGSGRRGSREFARFVDVATGSAYELECHLLLARDLEMIDSAQLASALAKIDEIKRMLIGLSQSLRNAAATD